MSVSCKRTTESGAEHISAPVLSLMGKPEHRIYEEFTRQFKKMNERLGMDQYLVPYLMSSHPGSTLKEAVELAEYCRDLGYMPEQVQVFIRHLLRFQLACIIRESIRAPVSLFMFRNPRMKKRCSAL